MEKAIGEFLSSLQLGEICTHKNLSVLPVFPGRNGGPVYRTLKEALQHGTLTISEVTDGGSVPELKAINKGDMPVLLLDGEELAGAKQNRVLNTTILIDINSETTIPVSCTEHGRWSYTSSHFGDSDVVMASNVRREKVRSVHENLKNMSVPMSDQGAVWDNIQGMADEAKVHSRTGAMKDVFESKEDELDDYVQAMKCVPGQKGVVVLINGLVVGLDCLSLESAYSVLHPKLVKSYAMEALLEAKKKPRPVSLDTAKLFLERTTQCGEKKYKSVGLGWDYRFEAERMVGSALEHGGHVIHAAFFPMNPSEKIDPMAGYRRRRAYRTQNDRGTL
jgi:hypothetical protein